MERLRSAWVYLYTDAARRLDFYLLWLSRLSPFLSTQLSTIYLYNYNYNVIQVPLRDGGGRGAEPLEDIRLHTEQQRPDGRDGGECEVRGGAVCG